MAGGRYRLTNHCGLDAAHSSRRTGESRLRRRAMIYSTGRLWSTDEAVCAATEVKIRASQSKVLRIVGLAIAPFLIVMNALAQEKEGNACPPMHGWDWSWTWRLDVEVGRGGAGGMGWSAGDRRRAYPRGPGIVYKRPIG